MDTKVVKIVYSSHFIKRFKKLPKHIQQKAVRAEDVFKVDFFDTRLNTHRLKGNKRDFWSFSVSFSYRIAFRFKADDLILFIDIGTHDIYQ